MLFFSVFLSLSPLSLFTIGILSRHSCLCAFLLFLSMELKGSVLIIYDASTKNSNADTPREMRCVNINGDDIDAHDAMKFSTK